MQDYFKCRIKLSYNNKTWVAVFFETENLYDICGAAGAMQWDLRRNEAATDLN